MDVNWGGGCSMLGEDYHVNIMTFISATNDPLKRSNEPNKY